MAAVFIFLVATLPPRPRTAMWDGDPGLPARTLAGAYHVHTTRSDGASDKATVAAAAARAGLQFVIFTEHGDGTTRPDPPAYLSGVLCLDGVEISSNGGHYVALDLAATPFPLGGEPAAVVEDVRRFGGFGVIAHPDSARAELAWADWTLPFDGVEWMNADSEWRNEPRPRVARALFDYWIRPGPALASLLDRPVMTLTRMDAVSTRRPVFALAGHDAHGGFGRGTEGGGWWGVPVPSYAASFATFATRVVVERGLSGDAAADARLLLDAIRAGRTFTAIDALAGPAVLDIRLEGERLVVEAPRIDGGEVVILRADGPSAGAEIVRSAETRHEVDTQGRGAYRVEIRLSNAPGDPPVPWIVSSPLRAGPIPTPVAHASDRLYVPVDPQPALAWVLEQDPTSRAELDPRVDGAVASYVLGADERRSPFAALSAPLPDDGPSFDAMAFTGRADAPMRLSVQLRYADGQRWGRSVYLDRDPSAIVVSVEELRPLDGQEGSAPDSGGATSILLVVDLVNAHAGSSGRFEIAGFGLAAR